MSFTDAITIILAYTDQGTLTGAQRRLLMTARSVIWESAEVIRKRAEERSERAR